MGKNWKGKTAGIVLMLMGAAGCLQGIGCMLDALVNSQDIFACWPDMSASATRFAEGMGIFGIRQAVGKISS